ncbi:MAG: hypothetical protein JSV56_02080 [Methanomassiliicoccales archaeon]|nr:MAG: hypothetical protein JSV56_02080 [Methanomassiliicoccales archaeon]
MKKKVLVGIIGIGLLLAAIFVVHIMKPPDDKAKPAQTNANLSKVVDVDEIVRHPDRFRGPIGVSGRVIKLDQAQASFALGCEDACVMVPVRYRGQMPALGSEIVVYGEIKEAEGGRYIFEGQEVKAR